MLMFWPFDRAPRTQGERKGPALLLQSLRGGDLDWDAIEKEFVPFGDVRAAHVSEVQEPMRSWPVESG